MRASLEPFSHAITRINTIIDNARIQNDDTYRDFLLDDDLGLIETHLGCAFITSQVFLTAVISRIKALHARNLSQAGTPFKTTTSSKPDILATASQPVPGAAFTQMQIIDAFANYFKHRDEWAGDWSKLVGQSAATVAVITSVGATQGSTGNLRTAAEVLGNRSYQDVESYADLIINWKDTLSARYREELLERRLIS